MDANDYANAIQRIIDKTYKLAICDVAIAMAESVDDIVMVELWRPARDQRAKEIEKLAEDIPSDLRHRP